MKLEEGRRIAERFIESQDMKRHTVKFMETKDLPAWPEELSVVFGLYSPSGIILDGPVIVAVEKHSGKARFLESP